MASFGITESALSGYRLAWRERRYLLYLAAVPILIKIICHMTVVMLDWRSEYIRQALVMLPSYFADGWMLAHLARLVFLNQRWPFQPSGDDAADRVQLSNRAHGILSGMLAFVIVEFLLAGFFDGFYRLTIAAVETDVPPSTSMATFMVLSTAGFVWLFRYYWFYIPAAIGFSLPAFATSLKGFATSFYMMALWFACTAPGIVVYFMFLSAFVPATPEGVPGTLSGEFIAVLGGAVIDTALACIVTAAMACAIRSMIGAHQKNH